MLRLAFLFLVVLGALAFLVTLFVGTGLYRAARLQEPAAEQSAATRPAATTTVVAAAPATHAITPEVAVRSSDAAPPPEAPLAVVINQPIVLSAKNAVLIGETVRLDAGPPSAIVEWTNRRDSVQWATTIPQAGLYDVEINYACQRLDGGGVITMRAGISSVTSSIRPTAGWKDFQSQYIGKFYLHQGAVDVSVRPVYLLPDARLMELRSVTLTFIKQVKEPEPRPSRRRRGEF